MSAFRTCRPLLVDATQCKERKTIATDLGFRDVKAGDWIIRGKAENAMSLTMLFFNARLLRSKHTRGSTATRVATTDVKLSMQGYAMRVSKRNGHRGGGTESQTVLSPVGNS